MRIDGDAKKLFLKGRSDPVFWSREIVGDTLYDKQEEVLYSIRDNTMTSVAAAHGVGKTFIASRAVGWFLTSHPESIVVTTAPSGRQVRTLLWSEINRMCAKSKYPLGPKPMTVTWNIAPGWYAIGLSTDDPNKFQGFHSGSGYILVVADEAAGVNETIFVEGIDPLLTSDKARFLMIGNPTEPTGRFYDSFNGPAKHLYSKIKISAFDTPNLKAGRTIYPYLVTPQWVDQRKLLWGEDSSAYMSRVLAQFPAIGSNTLIPAAWVERSFNYEWAHVAAALKHARVASIGVDPARYGDDTSAVSVRRGKVVTRLDRFFHVDTIKLAKEVKRIADEENIGTPSGTADYENFIVVDVIGIGSGVADWLRDQGYKVIDFNSGNKAFISNRFADRRAETWFNIRERFRTSEIMIPAYDEADGTGFHREEILDKLRGQFSGIMYKFDRDSRYVIESKAEMKKRLAGKEAAERGDAKGKSPDEADSIVHAFAFDSMVESIVIDDPDYEIAARIEVAKSIPDTLAHVMEIARKEREEEAFRSLFTG